MNPVLYYDDCDPPSRSCFILIKLINLNADLRYVDIHNKEELPAEFLEMNPRNVVPVFKHNGVTLTDSQSIMIYICETFEGGSDWWPSDSFRKFQVMNKLFVGGRFFRREYDMMLDIVRRRFENIDFNAYEKRIVSMYGSLEDSLKGCQYMAGDTKTIADLLFLTTLCTFDQMFIITPEKWPRLYHWYDSMTHSMAGVIS